MQKAFWWYFFRFYLRIELDKFFLSKAFKYFLYEIWNSNQLIFFQGFLWALQKNIIIFLQRFLEFKLPNSILCFELLSSISCNWSYAFAGLPLILEVPEALIKNQNLYFSLSYLFEPKIFVFLKRKIKAKARITPTTPRTTIRLLLLLLLFTWVLWQSSRLVEPCGEDLPSSQGMHSLSLR